MLSRPAPSLACLGIEPHRHRSDAVLGVIVGVVMAFGTIALAIIFSVT